MKGTGKRTLLINNVLGSWAKLFVLWNPNFNIIRIVFQNVYNKSECVCWYFWDVPSAYFSRQPLTPQNFFTRFLCLLLVGNEQDGRAASCRTPYTCSSCAISLLFCLGVFCRGFSKTRSITLFIALHGLEEDVLITYPKLLDTGKSNKIILVLDLCWIHIIHIGMQ